MVFSPSGPSTLKQPALWDSPDFIHYSSFICLIDPHLPLSAFIYSDVMSSFCSSSCFNVFYSIFTLLFYLVLFICIYCCYIALFFVLLIHWISACWLCLVNMFLKSFFLFVTEKKFNFQCSITLFILVIKSGLFHVAWLVFAMKKINQILLLKI